MSLLPYVPPLALAMLAEGPVPDTGDCRTGEAAVLFIDISGFTALCDIATARFGDQGAERLQELSNRCFAPIVDAVEATAGQILAFPGDAALCVWPVALGDGGSLRRAVQRATACALMLRERLDGIIGFDAAPLRSRAVITAGRVRTTWAGGVDGRWNLVVHGDAIEQLKIVEIATPDRVVLSDEAFALAEGSVRTWRSERGRVVTGLASGTQLQAGPRGAAPAPPSEVLAGLVPASVRARFDAGQQNWLSEFRNVAVVFLRARSSDLAAHTPHQIVSAIQRANQRLEGDLIQVVADEKGLNAITVFGLFQRTHEDDALRAVAAADEMRRALQGLGIAPGIGVTCGRVFTGLRGGESRKEFAVIGSTVVLAARLAALGGDTVCDAATRAASKHAFAFDPIAPVALKGKGVVSNLWRLNAPTPLHLAGEPLRQENVGRRVERTRLELRLEALSERGHGGIVVLTGEPGIGKSAIVASTRAAAASRGLACLVGAADSIRLNAALYPWRPVVAELLGASASTSADAARQRLAALVPEDAVDLLPVLNPVLPVQLPETEQSESMTAENRARVTRELLRSLLQRVAAPRLVLVFEDAHWCDSSSWELIEEVAQRAPEVLLLITSRPTHEFNARIAALAPRHDVEHIALGPMAADDIRGIVAARAGTPRISDELLDWLRARCEGNPLFAQELMTMLLEQGVAVVRDGICVADRARLAALTSLPDTVHGVLAARIDRLPPDDQLTVKVASILGGEFGVEALAAVASFGDDSIARIKRLLELGLLTTVPDRSGHVAFAHALVQEVAYSQLPFERRHALHQRAAEYFEQAPPEVEATMLPLLAHHWERAAVPQKAMHYLARAGEHALLKTSANPEAEEFFTRLIRLADSTPAARPGAAAVAAQRARWERLLSQSIARQARYEQALAHLERALQWVGHSMPRRTWRGALEAARGLTVRTTLPPRVRRGLKASTADEDRQLETMRIYDSIVQLLYLGQQSSDNGRAASAPLWSVVSLLRAVRLGERVGPSAELSCSYSMVANLLAMLGCRRLAIGYAERARGLALEVEDKQALFRALTMGQLPAFILGRWQEAEQRLREGIALGDSLRNVYESLIADCTLAYIQFHRGALDEAFEHFARIEQQAGAGNFVLPQLWAYAGMSEIRLRQERLSDAIDTATACLRIADERRALDQNSRFQAHGVLASARSRLGHCEAALAEIDHAARAASRGAHLSFAAQSGFVGVSEALLAAYDARVIDRVEAERRLRRWLWRFQVAAYCRPILAPWALHFRAALNRRKGRAARAKRQLRHSIRVAQALNLPHEAARGRLALQDLERA